MEKNDILNKYRERIVGYAFAYSKMHNIDLNSHPEEVTNIIAKSRAINLEDMSDLISDIEFGEFDIVGEKINGENSEDLAKLTVNLVPLENYQDSSEGISIYGCNKNIRINSNNYGKEVLIQTHEGDTAYRYAFGVKGDEIKPLGFYSVEFKKLQESHENDKGLNLDDPYRLEVFGTNFKKLPIPALDISKDNMYAVINDLYRNGLSRFATYNKNDSITDNELKVDIPIDYIEEAIHRK